MSKGCPKCNMTMEAGFLIDTTHGGTGVATWHRGAPRKSMWTGLKLSKADKIAVTTYRCPRCGFLESYALAG